jgi:hypothetical protein
MKRIIFATLALTFSQVHVFGMDTIGGEPVSSSSHDSKLAQTPRPADELPAVTLEEMERWLDEELAEEERAFQEAVAKQNQIDIAALAIACNEYGKRAEEANTRLEAIRASTDAALPHEAIAPLEGIFAQFHQKYTAAMATIQAVTEATKPSHEQLAALADCLEQVQKQRKELEQRELALADFNERITPKEESARKKVTAATNKMLALTVKQNKFAKWNPKRYFAVIPCTKEWHTSKLYNRKIKAHNSRLRAYASDRLELETARNTAKGKLDILLSTLAGLVSLLPKDAPANADMAAVD